MAIVETHIEIDTNFEKHINDNKVPLNYTESIKYKNWIEKGKKAEIYQLPLEYVRFRKENGRIKDDIITYEATKGVLDPNDNETQQLIGSFLKAKDPKASEKLKKLITADGQREAAVMTADGFLINGNRRKLALNELYKSSSQDEAFRFINVAILPGTKEAERPTYQDIAKLENRYEVNEDGKSSFTLMNKALSFIYYEREQKIEIGTLLRDDSLFKNLSEKEFKAKVKKYKQDYIDPVRLMEKYLAQNNSSGNFKKINDKYASFQEAQDFFTKLDDNNFLVKNKIDPIDVGQIQSAVFNIIKLKNHGDIEKRHNELIRQIPKYIKNNKNDILRIGKIDHLNPDPNTEDQDENDRAWDQNEAIEVLNILKKCKNELERKEDQQGPIDRLEEIIKKLKHKDLDQKQIERIPYSNILTANELATEIQNLAKRIASDFYDLKKRGDKSQLTKKFPNKH